MPVKAARKGSPHEACIPPIEEGEPLEEGNSSDKRYGEAVTLLRSSQPKVVVPYESSSEAADKNLRRIM